MRTANDEPLHLRRWGQRELALADAVLVAVYILFVLMPNVNVGSGSDDVPGWLRGLLYAGLAMPLLLRRRRPFLVLGVVAAVTLAVLLLQIAPDPFLALAFATYTVAVTWRGPAWLPSYSPGVVGAIALMGSLLSGPRAVWQDAVFTVLMGVALVGVSWTLGRAVRERRGLTAAATARQAERAVADERLRIARELHDVVAHSLSLVAVKASVANHVAETRPEEMPAALRVIETTSREALAELRQLLGVLRSDGTDGTDGADAPAGPGQPGLVGSPEGDPDGDADGDPTGGADGDRETAIAAPAPRAVDLPVLVERAALAGVRLELRTSGLDGLPEGLGLSVYRIVQEAVTNVVRHAAPAVGRVVVTADGHEVRIDVTDDGPGARTLGVPSDGPGHGLIGMRERVTMYGGTFTAGPRDGGGFAVSARLPYDAEASRERPDE